MFYWDLSLVMGGKGLDRDHESYAMALGGLLHNRNIAKKEIDEAQRKIKQDFLLDAANTTESFNDLKTTVNAIQKEAAAIRVLASRFRACI